MTDNGSKGEKPIYGMGRESIRVILAAAEPRRRAMLDASLCLTAAVAGAFALFFAAGGRSALIAALAAGFVATVLWTYCNRLWREKAIGALAPALAADWGQQSFTSGRFSEGLVAYVAGLFSHDGSRIVSWRGAGQYRGIPYEVREETSSIRRGRHFEQERPRKRHALIAEIPVPRPFSGSIEIHERKGVISAGIDEMLRFAEGDKARPVSVGPAFDAVFETIASPDASVDAVLTQALQQTMLTLAGYQGRVFIGKFEHGRFTLRLRIYRLPFASAHLLRPMPTLEDEVDALWWDLTLPHRLIDVLSGHHEGPLR